MTDPPRTVAQAQERYTESEQMLRDVFHPEQVWADGRDMAAHLDRYQRAFRVVELMMDYHDRIMKAVMGTHAARLPLPSPFGAPPEPLAPVGAPPAPAEPLQAVELLRLWMSAWIMGPEDAEGAPRLSGFELMRRTKEFLESVEEPGPTAMFYLVTLRWPVKGGHSEESFQGALELNPGASAQGAVGELLAAYAKQLQVEVKELTVLHIALTPELL
jgi:hypothetical protein